LLVNDSLIHEVLVGQPTKLVQPSLADNVTIHGRPECILSELLILFLVQISVVGPLNGSRKLVLVVMVHGEARTFFGVPLKLNDRVFKSSCSEGNHWSFTNKELVLDNSTWLKS